MTSQKQCFICDFCGDPITSDQTIVTDRGLPNILKISADLGDGIDKKIENKVLPFPAHKRCKQYYIKPSSIRKRKKQAEDSEKKEGTTINCRSKASIFNIKNDCLYCGQYVDYNKIVKQPKNHRLTTHVAATTELWSSVGVQAMKRNDDWGDAVYTRIQNVGDLVAAEAKYHHDCQVRFHNYRGLEKRTKGRPLGSIDCIKQNAFQKLCEDIDNSEQHQFSIRELNVLMNKYITNGDGYTPKRMIEKLQDYYKDLMIVTGDNGKETIYTFLNESNKILRDNYKASGMTSEDVLDMAATLIDDEMRTMTYDTLKYPKFSDMENSGNMVSPLLLRLLSSLIKSKRRQIGIAHSITSAARPRSFISPILLAISVYINSKFESRELIDLLSSLGFADDYRETLRVYDAMIPTEEKEYSCMGSLVNFVFDNADINTRTLTGHGTWHAMGGIAAITPGADYVEAQLPRSTRVRSAVISGRYAEIPIKRYRKPTIPGLKSVFIGAPVPPNPKPEKLKLATVLDNIWLTSYFVSNTILSPSWSGFNQTVVRQGEFDISRIEVLPFINDNPNHLQTIYSALSYAQNITEKYNLGMSSVTFDQPLYIKAVEIVQSSPDLSNLFVRLGGFHLIMSYMGAIGNIMSGSGLQNQWETVYSPNSVKHMLTGHAYARGLRAHMFSAASIVYELLDRQNCLTGETVEELKALHAMLLKKEYQHDDVLQEQAATHITDILNDRENYLSLESKTGKLWIQYLKMVRILLLFIRAERTGDWDLHLFCIPMMIPVLHSGGHTAYAKATRLYLDQMKQLPQFMDTENYKKYTTRGYWTIRRSHRFWSGGFTDQTIEQVLMRMLKTHGGLAHGRGITTGTQSKMVYVLPQTVPVCESLENFCGLHSQTSDQHTDLRESTTVRDSKHFLSFRNYLSTKSPFTYTGEYYDRLVCIDTGVVAPPCANADSAFNVGNNAASRLTGLNYADVKLKRGDKVISIGSATSSTSVRGRDIEIDPTVLFMRVTCVIKNSLDMEKHMKHEFSRQPPALFAKGTMRKNMKSSISNVIKGTTDPIPVDHLEKPHYVFDGGHLLHTVSWPEICTYGDVCDNYARYILHNYGTECTICFDGYSSLTMSTKVAEQNRRTDQNGSADIAFDLATPVTGSQRSILANRKNKSRLIDRLKEKLTNEGFTCFQSHSDADYMISRKTTEIAANLSRPVVLVAKDTDILVMLVDGATTDNLYMQHTRDSVHNINKIKQKMHPYTRQHILIGHAITGCDTVSALYGIGKKKAMAILETGEWRILDVFKNNNASPEEVAKAGELFLLKMYSANPRCISLDRLRFVQYMQKISKNSRSFQLHSLPPTSPAAKYHSYRAYFTVQEWLGNTSNLNPTDWGWELQNGILSPIYTDRPLATDHVLLIVSCGCKQMCGGRCKCKKAGLYCTPMCSSCIGQSCANSCPPDGEDETEEMVTI